MSISKKQVLYVAFIFISGVVIGAIAYSVARPLDKKNEGDEITTPPAQDQTATTTATTTPQRSTKPKRTGVDIDKQLTYQQAIERFDGRRIQFDNCFTLQPSMTLKGGTQIMLDNRSPDPHEIRLDGVPYRLWDYEFKIVTLGSYSGLHTVKIDCQVSDILTYNVAKILVQP